MSRFRTPRWGGLTGFVALTAIGCLMPARAAEAQQVGEVFRDCDVCPEMVVVPAGTFMMGSPGDGGGSAGQRRASAPGHHRLRVRSGRLRSHIRRMGVLACREADAGAINLTRCGAEGGFPCATCTGRMRGSMPIGSPNKPGRSTAVERGGVGIRGAGRDSNVAVLGR